MRRRQTLSEQLFEKYLSERELTFRYEQAPPGVAKPVDYTVEVTGITIRIDVKEWRPTDPSPGFGMHDPYDPIRRKIKAAQVKFQKYKGRSEPCVLVVCHHGPQLIMLSDWVVYGGMLGDLGWSFPIATTSDDRLPAGRQVFSGSGGMVRRAPGKMPVARNTTISSIAVLGAVDLRDRRVRMELTRQEREADHCGTTEERWDAGRALYEAAGEPSFRLRLTVYDNPVATVWPPQAFPAGPFDERCGLDAGRLRRTYIGSELAVLEAAELVLGITREDPLGLRR